MNIIAACGGEYGFVCVSKRVRRWPPTNRRLLLRRSPGAVALRAFATVPGYRPRVGEVLDLRRVWAID